jgi:hypothetical protein
MHRHYSLVFMSATPTVDQVLWALQAAQGEVGSVKEFWFGGEATTSTAMATIITRYDNTQAGALTGGNVAELGNVAGGAETLTAGNSYATTEPAPSGGPLFGTSWNAHGGVVRWLAAPSEEMWVVGDNATPGPSGQMGCENTVGTATSTYGFIWSE